MDSSIRKLIGALKRACKGKSDLEIVQIITEVQHNLTQLMSGDGTIEAAKAAMRAKRRTERGRWEEEMQVLRATIRAKRRTQRQRAREEAAKRVPT